MKMCFYFQVREHKIEGILCVLVVYLTAQALFHHGDTEGTEKKKLRSLISLYNTIRLMPLLRSGTLKLMSNPTLQPVSLR